MAWAKAQFVGGNAVVPISIPSTDAAKTDSKDKGNDTNAGEKAKDAETKAGEANEGPKKEGEVKVEEGKKEEKVNEKAGKDKEIAKAKAKRQESDDVILDMDRYAGEWGEGGS